MTTYIQVHGARLRWVKSTLQQAGVAVHDVQRGPDGLYYLAVNVADSARAAAALLPIENYVRGKQPARRPVDLRAMDALLLLGVVAAGVVALVTPLGGAVVLAVLAIVRWAFGNMHVHAKELADLGGKWRLYAALGVMLTMLVVAGFIATVGGMAAAEIAGGNSALKLLGG